MDDVFYIAMIAIHGVVEPPHFFCRNLAAKGSQNFPQRRMPLESASIHDGNSFISGKVVFVVFKNDESPGRDNAVGSSTRHKVDLLVFERAIKKSEIHQERRLGELQPVG